MPHHADLVSWLESTPYTHPSILNGVDDMIDVYLLFFIILDKSMFIIYSIRKSLLGLWFLLMSKTEIQPLVRLVCGVLDIILALLNGHLTPNLFSSVVYPYIVTFGQ